MKQVLTPKKYARLVELRAKETWTYQEWFEESRLTRLLQAFERKGVSDDSQTIHGKR